MDFTIDWGGFSTCETCSNRRRWSTGKTNGVYCRAHRKGLNMMRFSIDSIDECNQYQARSTAKKQ